MSNRGETFTRNVMQLAIREKLLMKRSLAQTGVAITVALLMHALHCFKSPTKSRINQHVDNLRQNYAKDAVLLATVLTVLQKVGLSTHCF